MTSRHDFRTVSSEDLHVGRVVALRIDDVEMPGGGTAKREIVEHMGAVAVVAVDASGEVVLIHQYRHALGRHLWELPAGLLDHDGEGVSVTAGADTVMLVLTGEPIDEPIVGYGPFVMNTQEEISQAIVDFNGGKFGRMH